MLFMYAGVGEQKIKKICVFLHVCGADMEKLAHGASETWVWLEASVALGGTCLFLCFRSHVGQT